MENLILNGAANAKTSVILSLSEDQLPEDFITAISTREKNLTGKHEENENMKKAVSI